MPVTRRLAWAALIVNIIVIAMGVLVRATASGAGCGRSWPTCQGTLVPAELSGATLIEFSHRATSGLAIILTFALFVWAARLEHRSPIDLRAAFGGSLLARATVWAAVTVTVEALIGAGIVLFEWVVDDSSIARVVAVPLHLVNTLLLLAALALSVGALRGPLVLTSVPARRSAIPLRPGQRERRALAVGFGSMVVVAGAGAVTALADTLFPSESLGAGIVDDFSATATWLTRVRVIHPVLAVITAVVLIRIVSSAAIPKSRRGGRWARAVVWLVMAQLTAGVLNVVLLTPVWMQIVHILLADLLWVTFVWFALDIGADQSKADSSSEVSTGAAHTISSQT